MRELNEMEKDQVSGGNNGLYLRHLSGLGNEAGMTANSKLLLPSTSNGIAAELDQRINAILGLEGGQPSYLSTS